MSMEASGLFQMKPTKTQPRPAQPAPVQLAAPSVRRYGLISHDPGRLLQLL
jgi:hypothetical protein